MKGPFALLWLPLVPAALFFSDYPASAASKHPDPVIASKLHISVQELHSLRARFNLTDDELVAMPGIERDEMLEEISHPGIDMHAAEQEFRTQKLKDENGNIPSDGLAKAMKAHYRHQHPEHPEHPNQDDEGDLFPALPDPSTNEPGFGDGSSGLAGIGTNNWTWLGPGNIGGRVRSILIHPTQTNIMWCGGVDGGVWKTTNSGAAWFPLNDFMGNLAIACMALDPANTNVLYAGTGEGTYNADAIRGAGIFKSFDGGSNWVQLASTANSSFQYVSRLMFDPTNSQTMLAATRSGIWRSSNGGTNWTQQLATETLCVAFNPLDSSQAIASGYNGNTFYSTNGGSNWTAATGIPAVSGFPNGRVELAYSASNPLIVYASVDTNGGSVYCSTDAGHGYALRRTGDSYFGGNSQGWYDNFVWADPVNTNTVIVGGTDVLRSTDGGVTFTAIGGYSGSIHPDQHVLVASPLFNGTTVRTIFVGNDGGVFRAGDAYTVSRSSGWQSLNNNLGITQFYGGAGNPASGVIVGGTQDNGSLRNSPGGGTSGWTAMFGGDGGFSAADQTDPLYFYGEYVFLQIHRSVNGGLSSSYIYSGISDAGTSSGANFIAPYILDPNNPNTMLAGGVSLWRSTNVKASPPAWTTIKPATTGNSHISAIAVAPGNPSVVWVGHANGDVYSTSNGTNASPTWVLRDMGTPNLPNRYCERIAICPTNANKVYVTFGGFSSPNVWRTIDSGASWSSISAGLPAAPVNAITIAPTDPNTLYVGTEVGIYGSTDDGATWSTGNDGPANVSVEELFWLSNKLVAVTHGRGMFVTTPTLGPPALAAAGSTISGGNGNGLIDPNECNFINLIVQNIGGGAATNVSAVLSTTTPGVTIVRGTAVYPNVAAGVLATNSAPFQITTSPAFACGASVSLSLTVTFNNVTNVLAYSVGTTPYLLTQSTGASIVPGTTDIGVTGDDVAATIPLPFNYVFYGQTCSNITVDSNGKLHFDPLGADYQNQCFPTAYANSIFALWDDLDTSSGGVFTSISGAAPNRIFNIEWRGIYFNSGLPVNFEARLYEGQQRLDLIYGNLNGNGSSATVGIQKDASKFTAFECNASGLSPGLQLTFQPSCSAGAGACAPFVTFTGSPTAGASPLQVPFTNSTAGATNYFWNFGDGNFSSTPNPTNTYVSAGTYSVTLTAVGPGGTNSLVRSGYILVTNTPAQLVVAPAALNLGMVFTGLTAQASFVVSNSGGSTLNGSALLSASTGPFTLLDPASNAVTAVPFTVSSAGTTNIGLSFTPPTVSTFSNAVVFTSNGGNSTNSVTAQGLVAPSIQSPALDSNRFTFSFNTVNGKTYVIQYKDDLIDPIWQTLQTIGGDGTLKTITNSTAVPAQRFYRLSAH
jgi:PKD repeat protein